MSLEVDLERALDAAARLHPARPGPMRCFPPSRMPALASIWPRSAPARKIRYLAVDARGDAVTDACSSATPSTMLALAERADEVSGAVAAEELEDAFTTAVAELEAAGLAGERDAADAVRRAVAALAAAAAGPRVATPAYLDRIAACAASSRRRWTSSPR